jgi:hypothetical protein
MMSEHRFHVVLGAAGAVAVAVPVFDWLLTYAIDIVYST